jgi:hypothetical protein
MEDNMIRIRTAALALVMLSGFSTAALAAGQISEDALNADRKSCQTACTNKGQSGDFCSSYCDCTVKGIGDPARPQQAEDDHQCLPHRDGQALELVETTPQSSDRLPSMAGPGQSVAGDSSAI